MSTQDKLLPDSVSRSISESAFQSISNSTSRSSSSILNVASLSAKCLVCNDTNVIEFGDFKKLKRVTSDCRAWQAGGRLAACQTCGLVFKPVDPSFLREAEAIYGSYAIYHQSSGREQRVRHLRTGTLVARSTVLAEMLLEEIQLPAFEKINFPDLGSLLDVGCGNGAFLKAFSAVRPGWELRGTEHDHRHVSDLEKIHGFKELFLGNLPTPPASHHPPTSLRGATRRSNLIQVRLLRRPAASSQ